VPVTSTNPTPYHRRFLADFADHALFWGDEIFSHSDVLGGEWADNPDRLLRGYYAPIHS
jgi:hypothetical protein